MPEWHSALFKLRKNTGERGSGSLIRTHFPKGEEDDSCKWSRCLAPQDPLEGSRISVREATVGNLFDSLPKG